MLFSRLLLGLSIFNFKICKAGCEDKQVQYFRNVEISKLSIFVSNGIFHRRTEIDSWLDLDFRQVCIYIREII